MYEYKMVEKGWCSDAEAQVNILAKQGYRVVGFSANSHRFGICMERYIPEETTPFRSNANSDVAPKV